MALYRGGSAACTADFEHKNSLSRPARQSPYIHFVEIDKALADNDYAHAQHLINQSYGQTYEKHQHPRLQATKVAVAELNLPYHAAAHALTKGEALGAVSLPQNTTYLRTSEIIRTALQARNERLVEDVERYTEREMLTGIISELAIFALLTREGESSPFIPTFATLAGDASEYVGKKQKRTGFDLRVIPIDDPRYQTLVQAKTANFKEEHGRYINHITPISIQEISNQNHKGGRSLQWAIADDGAGKATVRQRQLILGSERRLKKKIIDGLHRRPEL